MNSKFPLWRRCVVVVILTGLIPAKGRCADEEPYLSVSAYADKQELTVHEPLMVCIGLRNQRQVPLAIYRDHRNGLEVWGSREGGAYEMLYKYKRQLDEWRDFWFDLEPMREFRWDEVLFWRENADEFGGEEFVFTEPGRYQLKARLTWKYNRGRIVKQWESDVFEVVVKPLREEDRDAQKLLLDPQVAACVQKSNFPNAETQQRLLEIVEKYPDSPYADFVNFRLASQYRWQPPKHTAPREEQLAHARKLAKHYCAISERSPGLRKRCAYEKLYLLIRWPELRPEFDFYEIQREITNRVRVPDSARRMPTISDWPTKYLRAYEIYYLDDKRLDQPIDVSVPGEGTNESLCREVSKATGVPLRLEGNYPRGRFVDRGITEGVQVSSSLRNWMTSKVNDFTYWKRDGDGYVLIVGKSSMLQP